jgi:hypothetical protein
MAEWHVNLQGDDFDLAELAARFASQDFLIQREGTAYYLMADELNTLEDPREVLDAAERILLPLNGLAKLMLSTRRPLSVGSLYQVEGDGKNRHYLLAESPAPLNPPLIDEFEEDHRPHRPLTASHLARPIEFLE